MPGRTRTVDAAAFGERAARARRFLLEAETIDPVDSAARAVATSCAVEAGIAAADAVCGRRLGMHSSSDRHQDALDLLAEALPRSAAARNALHRLLNAKSTAQYGTERVSPGFLAQNLERARLLVRVMEDTLAAP